MIKIQYHRGSLEKHLFTNPYNNDLENIMNRTIKLRLILIALFMSFSAPSFADVESINQYIKTNQNWVNEKSSSSYLGVRCAVLYGMSLERTKLSNAKEAEPLTKELENRADVFLLTSRSLSAQLGVSDDISKERIKFWGDTYLDYGKNNWLKYNNFYVGLIEEDLKSCSDALPVYLKLIKEIANEIDA
jgi:hypothetical protein